MEKDILARALKLANEGLPDKAIPLLWPLVKMPQMRVPALAIMAHCFDKLHQFPKAKYLFQEAMRLEPTNQNWPNHLQRVETKHRDAIAAAQSRRPKTLWFYLALLSFCVGIFTCLISIPDEVFSDLFFEFTNFRSSDHFVLLAVAGGSMVLLGFALCARYMLLYLRYAYELEKVIGKNPRALDHIKCIQCSLQMHTSDPECPYCGYQRANSQLAFYWFWLHRHRRSLAWAAGGVFLLITVGKSVPFKKIWQINNRSTNLSAGMHPASLTTIAPTPTVEPNPLPTPKMLAAPDVVAAVDKSIALIRHAHGSGTGFVIAENIMITNYHVLDGIFPDEIEVNFPSVTSERAQTGRILAFDEKHDYLLLEVNAPSMPLQVSPVESHRLGEDVIVIGNPGFSNDLILKNTVTRGSLNDFREIDGVKYAQIAAAVNPGNSGGPALNMSAEVIGMITLKASQQEGVSFAIPIETLFPRIEAARSMQDAERTNAQVQYVAYAITKRLDLYCKVNLLAALTYIKGMGAAVELGLEADTGLDYASQQIDEDLKKINDLMNPARIENNLKTVHASAQVPQEVKENLIELWSCASEIRDYVDIPRGNFNSYTSKIISLAQKYQQSAKMLAIRLNIPEQEE